MRFYIKFIISFLAIFIFTGCYEGDIYLKEKSHNSVLLDLSKLINQTFKQEERMFVINGHKSGPMKSIVFNIYEADINHTVVGSPVVGIWDKTKQELSLKGLSPNTKYTIKALNSNELEVKTLPLLSGEVYWKSLDGEYLTGDYSQIYLDNNQSRKVEMYYNEQSTFFQIRVGTGGSKYLGLDSNGILSIVDGDDSDINNQFEYIENSDNTVSFKSKKTGTYLMKDATFIRASSTTSNNLNSTKFTLEHIARGVAHIKIRSSHNDNYVVYDHDNNKYHATEDHTDYNIGFIDYGLHQVLYDAIAGKFLTPGVNDKHLYPTHDSTSHKLTRFKREINEDGTESLRNHATGNLLSFESGTSSVMSANTPKVRSRRSVGDKAVASAAFDYHKLKIKRKVVSSFIADNNLRDVSEGNNFVKSDLEFSTSSDSTAEFKFFNLGTHYIIAKRSIYTDTPDAWWPIQANPTPSCCSGNLLHVDQGKQFQGKDVVKAKFNADSRYHFAIEIVDANKKQFRIRSLWNHKTLGAENFYGGIFGTKSGRGLKANGNGDIFTAPSFDHKFAVLASKQVNVFNYDNKVLDYLSSWDPEALGPYPALFTDDVPSDYKYIYEDYGIFKTLRHKDYGYLTYSSKWKTVLKNWNYLDGENPLALQLHDITVDGKPYINLEYQLFDRSARGYLYSDSGDIRPTNESVDGTPDNLRDHKYLFYMIAKPDKVTVTSLEANNKKFIYFHNSDKKFFPEGNVPLYNIIIEDYGSFVALKSVNNGKYIKTISKNYFYQIQATEDHLVNINTHYKIEHLDDGRIAIKSLFNNKYVSLFDYSGNWTSRLAANSDTVTDRTKFWLLTAPKERTVSLQANNNKFVNFESRDLKFYAKSKTPLQNITLIDHGSFVSLKSKDNNRYLKVHSGYGNQISASADDFLDNNSRFIVKNLDDGRVAIKSVGFNQYVAIKSNSWGDTRLTAGTATVEDKSKFWITTDDSSYKRESTDTLTQNTVNYLTGKELSDVKLVTVRDKNYNILTGRYNASTGVVTLSEDDEVLYIEITTKDGRTYRIKLYRSFGYPFASFKIKNHNTTHNCKQIEKSGSEYNLADKSCSDSRDWYYSYAGWLYQEVKGRLICASQNGDNLSDASFVECNYKDSDDIFSADKEWIIDPYGNDDFIVKSKVHFDHNTTYNDPFTFVELEQFAGSLKSNYNLSPLVTYDTTEDGETVTKVSPIDFWSNSASLFKLKDQSDPWQLDISYFPFNHEFKSLDFVIPFTIADYHTKAAANENINAEFNVAEYFKIKVYRTDDSHSNKVLRIEASLDCSIVQRPEYCTEDNGSKKLILNTDILENDEHYLDEFGLFMIKYNKDTNSLALSLGTKNYQNSTLTRDNSVLAISRAAMGDNSFYKLTNSMRLISASQTQTNASNVDLIFNNSIMNPNPEKPAQLEHHRQKRSFWTWFGAALFVVGAVLITVGTGGTGAPLVLGILAVGAGSSLIIGDGTLEESHNAKLPTIQNNPVVIQKANIKTLLTAKDKALLYSINDNFAINIDQLDTSSANFHDKGSLSFGSDGIVNANIFGGINKNIKIVCGINTSITSTYMYKCSSDQDVTWSILSDNTSHTTIGTKALAFNTTGDIDPAGIVIQSQYTHNSKDYFVKHRVHLANDLNHLNKDVSILSTGSKFENIVLSRGEQQFGKFETTLNQLNILRFTEYHDDNSITKSGLACVPLFKNTYLGTELIERQSHNYVCAPLSDNVTNLRLAKNASGILHTKDPNGKYILLTIDSSNVGNAFINADLTVAGTPYTITQRVAKKKELGSFDDIIGKNDRFDIGDSSTTLPDRDSSSIQSLGNDETAFMLLQNGIDTPNWKEVCSMADQKSSCASTSNFVTINNGVLRMLYNTFDENSNTDITCYASDANTYRCRSENSTITAATANNSSTGATKSVSINPDGSISISIDDADKLKDIEVYIDFNNNRHHYKAGFILEYALGVFQIVTIKSSSDSSTQNEYYLYSDGRESRDIERKIPNINLTLGELGFTVSMKDDENNVSLVCPTVVPEHTTYRCTASQPGEYKTLNSQILINPATSYGISNAENELKNEGEWVSGTTPWDGSGNENYQETKRTPRDYIDVFFKEYSETANVKYKTTLNGHEIIVENYIPIVKIGFDTPSIEVKKSRLQRPDPNAYKYPLKEYRDPDGKRQLKMHITETNTYDTTPKEIFHHVTNVSLDTVESRKNKLENIRVGFTQVLEKASREILFYNPTNSQDSRIIKKDLLTTYQPDSNITQYNKPMETLPLLDSSYVSYYGTDLVPFPLYLSYLGFLEGKNIDNIGLDRIWTKATMNNTSQNIQYLYYVGKSVLHLSVVDAPLQFAFPWIKDGLDAMNTLNKKLYRFIVSNYFKTYFIAYNFREPYDKQINTLAEIEWKYVQVVGAETKDNLNYTDMKLLRYEFHVKGANPNDPNTSVLLGEDQNVSYILPPQKAQRVITYVGKEDAKVANELVNSDEFKQANEFVVED